MQSSKLDNVVESTKRWTHLEGLILEVSDLPVLSQSVFKGKFSIVNVSTTFLFLINNKKTYVV